MLNYLKFKLINENHLKVLLVAGNIWIFFVNNYLFGVFMSYFIYLENKITFEKKNNFNMFYIYRKNISILHVSFSQIKVIEMKLYG